MVSSLRQYNYRLYFFGQLISVAGTWMQAVAQSFLVLDLTHSGSQLGLTTAARFLPMFGFGPAGGAAAKSFGSHKTPNPRILPGQTPPVSFPPGTGPKNVRLRTEQLSILAGRARHQDERPGRPGWKQEKEES